MGADGAAVSEGAVDRRADAWPAGSKPSSQRMPRQAASRAVAVTAIESTFFCQGSVEKPP